MENINKGTTEEKIEVQQQIQKKEINEVGNVANKKERRREKKSKRRRRSRSKKSRNRSKKSRRRHREKSKKSRRRSRSSSGYRRRKQRSRSNSQSRNYKRNNQKYHKYNRDSRSYSNSPLRNYTWRQQMQDPQQQTIDDNAARKYWDGFHWVVKTNHNPNKDPAIMQQTQRMRKIQISNLPLYLGLTDQDIYQLVTKYLVENYLCEKNSSKPVVQVELDEKKQCAVVELSSLDEATRMVKLGVLGIFNHNCKITRHGELLNQLQGNSLASLVQSAQTTAQAQAAAHIAMQQFSNVAQSTNANNQVQLSQQIKQFSLGNGLSQEVGKSRIIKVYNFMNYARIMSASQKDWDEIEGDIVTEFTDYGAILSCFIVKPNQSIIGAQAGSLFIEFNQHEEAQNAIQNTNNRIYDGNEIKVLLIPEDVYFKNFYPIQTNNTIVKQ